MSEYTKIVLNQVPGYTNIQVQRLPDHVKVFYENIIVRIVEVEPFTKVLSGLTETILQAEHGLSVVRGLRVCKPTGELVEVAEKFNGTTVQINSNILLDDHILTIY